MPARRPFAARSSISARPASPACSPLELMNEARVTKSPTPHPAVTFAVGYSQSWSTLNASAAISRCDSFLRDIELARQSMRKLKSADEWAPHFGLEIFSYYPVGFVTCLEWHARARLVDLFNFKPSCIEVEDLRGNINDKVLSQMVAAGVGVPEIMGASLSVGSAEVYFSTIRRVFTELSISSNQANILMSLRSDSVDNPMEVLRDLFERRHRLIHEISLGEVGSWMMRDNIDLDEAARLGKLVLMLMKRIEAEITAQTPANFPNRLTIDGDLEDPSDYLDREIVRLQNEIANSIKVNPEIAGDLVTPDVWRKEIEASASASIASTEFLQSCNFAGQRHFDSRGPLLVSLKINRVRYLTKLAENFL